MSATITETVIHGGGRVSGFITGLPIHNPPVVRMMGQLHKVDQVVWLDGNEAIIFTSLHEKYPWTQELINAEIDRRDALLDEPDG